jgi:hypothetical protein
MNSLDHFTAEDYNDITKDKGTNVNNIKLGDIIVRNGVFATVSAVEEKTCSTPSKRQVDEFTVKTHTNELLWLTPKCIIDQGWQLLLVEELYLPK